VKILIDNQLPLGLVFWLQERGLEALHVRSIQMNQSLDLEIWNKASSENWIILTKDEDFALLSEIKTDPIQVVWLRFGNTRKKELLSRLEQNWEALLAELLSGTRVVELW